MFDFNIISFHDLPKRLGTRQNVVLSYTKFLVLYSRSTIKTKMGGNKTQRGLKSMSTIHNYSN